MRTSLRIALAILALPFASPALAAWPDDPAANVPVCAAIRGQQFPVAVADGRGGAIVAWWDLRNGANFDIYAQRILASGTADPAWPASGRALCAWGGDQQYPAIASDGNSGAIVAWCDARAGLFDLYAQHVLASGTLDPAWPAGGRAVYAGPGGQWFPAIVPDGAGGAFVAWHDSRSGDMDLYAQHVLATGALDPAWPASGLVVCDAANDQEHAQLVPDEAGTGVLVTWADARGGVNFDIYAQHVLATGAVDPAWPVNGRALCTAPSNQLYPRLTGDGAAGAIVVWTDARVDTAYDVYAQHVLADGALDPAWPADGLAICDVLTNQTEPRIVADGAGGAIVAWTDERAEGQSDIYAQHVTAAGGIHPSWPAGGKPVCTAPEFQHAPDLVPDGATPAEGGSGAIVTWADSRAGGSHDIYAQHLTASGADDPAWPAGGLALCAADGDQQYPVIVRAGPTAGAAGAGAIVVWDDDRGGNFDIYAQRVMPFAVLGSPEPVVSAVLDVKPDQGGFVTVTWLASPLDTEPANGIVEYRLWRSIPELGMASGARLVPGAGAGGGRLRGAFAGAGAWELVGALASTAAPSYSLVVQTPGDSVAAGVPRATFVVEALTSLAPGTPYWFSLEHEGYSVDDLAPASPGPLMGEYVAGTTHLRWPANHEHDLARYRVYRGLSAAFMPAAANLVASPSDTSWADAAGAPYVYKLTAVDAHGNESPAATFLPGATAGPGGPAAPRAFLALAGPNPARGAIALRFGLAVAGRASLELYDAGGRRVRTLASGDHEPGEFALEWDGRDDHGRAVAPGLYFARLEAPGIVTALRIVRTE